MGEHNRTIASLIVNLFPLAVDEPNREVVVDVYALGVTLYHAAVGRPPFPTDDPQRCMRMHREDPVPPPAQVRPDVPRALSDLLVWMLQKKPTDRPESYKVLQQALRRTLASLPLADTSERTE